MKAAIVIPAYNEERTIGEVISQIRKLGPEYKILVVDDGSNDNTRESAGKAGAEVISHPYQKGYGAALKTGIINANSDVVIFMDADGQHDVSCIPSMVDMLETFDMVIGDRSKSIKSPMYRLPGKWFLGKTANLLVNHNIPDLNCGFRCLKTLKIYPGIHTYPNKFCPSTRCRYLEMDIHGGLLSLVGCCGRSQWNVSHINSGDSWCSGRDLLEVAPLHVLVRHR